LYRQSLGQLLLGKANGNDAGIIPLARLYLAYLLLRISGAATRLVRKMLPA